MLCVSSKFIRRSTHLLPATRSRVVRPVLLQCCRTVWTKDDPGVAIKSVWETVQEKAAVAKEYVTDKSKHAKLSEKAGAALEVAKEKANVAKDFVVEKSKNAKVAEKADVAKEFVSEKMELAKEKAAAAGQTVWQNVQHTAEEVKVRAVHLGKQAAESVEAKAGDAKVYFEKLSQEDARAKLNAQQAAPPDSTDAKVERAAREAREKAERYLAKYPEGFTSGGTIAEKATTIGHHAEEVVRGQKPGASTGVKENAQSNNQTIDTESVERAAREARDKAERYLAKYPEGFACGDTIAEKATCIGRHAEEMAREKAGTVGATLKATAQNSKETLNNAAGAVREKISDVGEQVIATEGKAAEDIKEQAQTLKKRIHEKAEAEKRSR